MNTVISKISEIEAAATAIMDDANVRKKAFAKEMDEKSAAFDAQLEKETAKTISELRAQMEVDMKSKLAEQQAGAERLVSQLETNYESNHTAIVEKLFADMIKE